MISLIVSILAFGIIVLIHEFGHFIMAKAFGVGVIEFSIGMGPRLMSLVRGNTRYSIKALPFGGSCLMMDEELSDDEIPRGKDGSITVDGRIYPPSCEFSSKSPIKRFIIIAAGPIFNFILAFILAVIVVANIGYQKSEIVEVEKGYPAYETGIEPGDSIISIGRDKVRDYNDIMLYMLVHKKDFAGPVLAKSFLMLFILLYRNHYKPRAVCSRCTGLKCDELVSELCRNSCVIQ